MWGNVFTDIALHFMSVHILLAIFTMVTSASTAF